MELVGHDPDLGQRFTDRLPERPVTVDHDCLHAGTNVRRQAKQRLLGAALVPSVADGQTSPGQRVEEHGLEHEPLPERALVHRQHSRRADIDLDSGVVIEGLDDSVEADPVLDGDLAEGPLAGLVEQLTPEPLGHSPLTVQARVPLPARPRAVPATKATLVPDEHHRSSTGTVSEPSSVSAVADHIDRSAVPARSRERRSDVHLEVLTDAFGTDHVEVVELQRDLDTVAHRGLLRLSAWSLTTVGRPLSRTGGHRVSRRRSSCQRVFVPWSGMVMCETPEVLEALDEIEATAAELCGQRHAITAQLIDLVARLDGDDAVGIDGRTVAGALGRLEVRHVQRPRRPNSSPPLAAGISCRRPWPAWPRV